VLQFFWLYPAPAALSEKKTIAASFKDNILKHTPLLRDPLYGLQRSAIHLENWVHGLLPRGDLLDVSAQLSCSYHEAL